MKNITEELKHKIWRSHSGGGTERVKWDSIFDTEQELIEAMFHEKVYTDTYEDGVPYCQLCKGYEYIKSFRKYYTKNGRLTDNQMRQLKRLAVQIAYSIYCAPYVYQLGNPPI